MAARLLIEPGYEALLRANRLTEFDDFMRCPAAGPAASVHWNRETVPVELCAPRGTRRFFLKRLFRPQPEHLIGDLLRGRRPIAQPVAEWHNIQRLEAASIPCMRRVAAGARSV
ncbi:MAG: hypothetical protein V3T70_01935, partial [Phycisphaerae bacterium]